MYSIQQMILHTLAEIEALRVKPGDNLFWRKKEFNNLGIRYKRYLWVGRNLNVYRYGDIFLGERCALGDNVLLTNHSAIKIGDNFIGADNLLINSGTHDPITLAPCPSPIDIGNRVWCGVKVTIIAGVKIGDDVVIGAGSVVTEDLPSNCIAVGVPARPVKELVRNNLSELWSWI